MQRVTGPICLKYFCIAVLFLFFPGVTSGQVYNQRLTGMIVDAESHKPLSGASVQIETLLKMDGVSSDSSGRFRVVLPPGRHTLKVSFVGYSTRILKNIQIGSGKETIITVELTEAHQ